MADLVVIFPRVRKNEDRLKPTIQHFRDNPEGYDYFVFKIGKSRPKRAEKGKSKCFIGFDNRINGYFIFEKAEDVSKSGAKNFVAGRC